MQCEIAVCDHPNVDLPSSGGAPGKHWNRAALDCSVGGFRQCAQRKALFLLMPRLVIEPQVSNSAC